MCPSQLDQITVFGYFCIYCCLHKIRRSDALEAFVKSIYPYFLRGFFVACFFSLLLFSLVCIKSGFRKIEPNFRISVYRD